MTYVALARQQRDTVGGFQPLGELMSRVRAAVSDFLAGEEAIAVTEYGLLVALVAIGMIGAVSVFREATFAAGSARAASITTV